jgi:Tfp pilus assembly protein PilO
MSATQGQERRADKKNSLLERLHNPAQLRLFLAAAVLGVGYAAVYLPLGNSIAAATANLEDAKKRLGLADEVAQLRKQFQKVEKRLPAGTDSNEWVQYVLAGIRRSPLKLNAFNPAKPQVIGPYSIVVLKLNLSGSYADIDRFLCWLESNERLFRVDSVKLAPGASKDSQDELNMDILVLGLMG